MAVTPESPDRQYSTRLRTALVLTGTGTAGAYHAGVLRALHEAGIRIDLVAARGIGSVGAAFAAMDGGARLWEPGGLWRGAASQKYYAWRPALRAAGWSVVAAGAIVAVPLVLLVAAVIAAMAGMILTFVGLTGAGTAIAGGYARVIAAAFAPHALPTVIPRLALLAVLVAIAAGFTTLLPSRRGGGRRRAQRGLAGRVLGGPLAAASLAERCTSELWNLIRGAAPLGAPPRAELARRFIDLLTENLGQPGFRELLIIVHDLDARRDLVFALLGGPYRGRFFNRQAPDTARAVEAFDLTGVARDHALDAVIASLALPIGTEPHLVHFAPEGPWRGESHRLCDRPGSLARVIEEVTAAGAEQIILAAATPAAGRPHELSAGRADLRGYAAEQLASFEAAALRDVVEHAAGRYAGLFVIRPLHNPLGPLDFAGIYDERSDRVHTLGEQLDRGYEDAYRQFIEPIVAGSAERTEAVHR